MGVVSLPALEPSGHERHRRRGDLAGAAARCGALFQAAEKSDGRTCRAPEEAPRRFDRRRRFSLGGATGQAQGARPDPGERRDAGWIPAPNRADFKRRDQAFGDHQHLLSMAILTEHQCRRRRSLAAAESGDFQRCARPGFSLRSAARSLRYRPDRAHGSSRLNCRALRARTGALLRILPF